MKLYKGFLQISDLKFKFILVILFLDIITNMITIILDKKKYINRIEKKKLEDTFLNLEDFDSEILTPIQNNLKGFIEITIDEQRFLNGIIRKAKPKKIVEIGVAYGGTAALILNAINDIDHAKLYSIDIKKNCYRIPSKKTGFLVKEKFSYLTKKWEIYTGGLTSQFIEKIGNEVDLVYIDTAHLAPGEMLNWLEILPFLKEEALVVLHDTFLMYIDDKVTKKIRNFSNNQILCYIRGKLILPSYNNNTFSRNIGAIKLFKNQEKYYLNYFLALGTQWEYLPSDNELNILKNHFSKYYGAKYSQIFNDAIFKNKLRFQKL